MSEGTSTYVGQLSDDRRWRWDGTAWRPVGLSLPRWAGLKLRSRPTWKVVAGAAVVGLLADQAIRVGVAGLAVTITIAFAAVALLLAGDIRRLESRLLLVTAALFGLWLTARASPWLIWPDIAVALALLTLAASIAVKGSLMDIGLAEVFARGAGAAINAVAGIGFVSAPIGRVRSRLTALAPVARGLLIAIPIVAVMTALLASADPIFASFLTFNFDVNQVALDVIYVLVGALVTAGLLRLAATVPVDRVDGPLWRLGTTEALVVLVGLDVVFAAFAIAQAIGAGGTGAATLQAAGVTYADYARSGFFQLLWVAGITLVLLVVFSRITGFAHRAGRVAFVVLAEAAILLTLLVVLVASMRLSLYEDAYGFTMLRLYSHLFAGLIAAVFVLLAFDLAGLWRDRRWFVGASTLTALCLLMALNVVNPEAIVVALNTDRAIATHDIDAQYLSGLSSDAGPTLLESQSHLEPALAGQVYRVACAGAPSYSPSVAAFNLADAAAADARRHKC
jgi:hypothetical protein